MDNIFGPGYPAPELAVGFRNRLFGLYNLYHFGIVIPPLRRVEGVLTLSNVRAGQGRGDSQQGIGIPDIDLILDGDHVGNDQTLIAATGPSGRFVFEFVREGNFTLLPADPNGPYAFAPVSVEVTEQNVNVDITAVPTSEAGHYIAGVVENSQGLGLSGIPVALKNMESGEVRTVMTLDNGSFLFTGLTAADWKVYPLEQTLEAVPGFVIVRPPPSPETLVFVMHTEPVIVPGDMNGDNLADLRDLILVLQILAGADSAIADSSGDVNKDGKIDLLEAVYLIKKMVREN